MPPQQGEVSLLTLFADIHYYFSPPHFKTPHHRFDKSSYVYLYHNPMQQRGRIEVANHAGTPDQDAFAGNLDTVTIEQTYKHPCLFTLTVDAFRNQNGSAAPSPQQDISQWHLPAPDPQNNGKYMYRLHAVDIYFWTPDDASLFLDSVKRVVQPQQLQILANPNGQVASAQSDYKHDAMNPVVAKLERAAISHTSRSPSLNLSTQHSYPGPPAAPASTSSPPAADSNTHYAPMAYNPAAPAAPEPIAHREKTPPPPDAADGTGLGNAALNDHQNTQPYGNPLQAGFAPQPTSGPYMPGPPSRTSTFSGPPQQPGIQRSSTVGSIPPPPQSPPSFAPPPAGPPPNQPPAQQYANHPGTPGFPPTQSPLPSPGYAQQPYQPMASPPAGGYAQYQYASTTPQQPSADQYALHQQLYRPTEQEAGIKDHERVSSGEKKSNMGKRAEKLEKGIGGFLKKLDKKF